MPNLSELQNQFYDYLLSKNDSVLEQVVNQGDIDSTTRLEIYRNAYRVRLIKCIESDHPVLCTYLGDDLFEQMSTAYLAEYPSNYTSLRHYCDRLPKFLKEQSPFSDIPILAELADFERRMMSAFDAAESEKRATLNDLQAIEAEKWPMIRLKFHPSVSLFQADWNSVQSWQALKEEQTPPAADECKTDWIIWRGEDRLTQFRNMPPEAVLMFHCFNDDACFAEVCDFLLEHLPEDQISELAVQHMVDWLNMGLIQQITNS